MKNLDINIDIGRMGCSEKDWKRKWTVWGSCIGYVLVVTKNRDDYISNYVDFDLNTLLEKFIETKQNEINNIYGNDTFTDDATYVEKTLKGIPTM